MYIGIDLENISRIQQLLTKKPHILQKMFFNSEWLYAHSKGNPASTLTGIWCAKEAVLKAFAPHINLDLKQIEIIKNAKGYPEVSIMHAEVSKQYFHISVSISHTKDLATATALLQLIN